MLLSNSQTDCVGETLPERSCGDLNTWGIMSFWMTRSDAVDLLNLLSACVHLSRARPSYSEILQVIDSDLIAKQVQQCVLEHTTMAVSGSTSAIDLNRLTHFISCNKFIAIVGDRV